MKKAKSLYDIINEGKPAKVKKRKWSDPVPIGHHLAINIYHKGIFLDTLFVDNIDISRRSTMICYNPRSMEEFPAKVENTIIEVYKVWVMYENDIDFEVIRIS